MARIDVPAKKNHVNMPAGPTEPTPDGNSPGETLRRHRLEAGLSPEERPLGDALSLSPDDRAHQQRLSGEDIRSAVPATPPASGWRPAPPPSPQSRLIGRSLERRALLQVLQQPGMRLLTLTGPAGVGKSRVAIAVAEDAAGLDGEIGYVDLAVVSDDTLVPTIIAQALGVREQGSRGALDQLVSAIKDQHLLLVLDNFERVPDAAAVLATLLERCPNLQLLVTSRSPLSLQGERTLPVAPLAVPVADSPPGLPAQVLAYPGLELFVERSQAVDPTLQLTVENGPSVAAICHALGGLPLALELVAPNARLLPLPAILVQLNNLQEQQANDSAGAPAQHLTLRAVMAWSYEQLGDAEQAALRRLSVFAGGFTLDAAHTVLATLRRGTQEDDASTLHTLDSLITQGFVRRDDAPGSPGAGRYSMPESVREFARERLAASGETGAARAAHTRWCFDLVDQATNGVVDPQQQEWLRRLDVEHANLRRALDWLASADDIAPALQLAAGVAWFWWYRGHFAEGRARLEALLAHPGAQQDARAWASAMDGLGILLRAQGNTGRAVTIHEQAVLTWRSLSAPDRLADSLSFLGLSLMYSSDSLARPVLVESVAIARKLTKPRWLGSTLWALGRVLRYRGELHAAREAMEESLHRATVVGNPFGVAVSLWGLGEIEMDEGNLETALAMLKQALGRLWNLGNEWSAIFCLERIAAVLAKRGEREAITLEAAATAWRERIGLPLPAVDVERNARKMSGLYEQLDAVEVAALWHAGLTLAPAQGVALALET